MTSRIPVQNWNYIDLNPFFQSCALDIPYSELFSSQSEAYFDFVFFRGCYANCICSAHSTDTHRVHNRSELHLEFQTCTIFYMQFHSFLIRLHASLSLCTHIRSEFDSVEGIKETKNPEKNPKIKCLILWMKSK